MEQSFQAAKEAYEAADAKNTADFADLLLHISLLKSPSNPRYGSMEAPLGSPEKYINGEVNQCGSLVADYDKVQLQDINNRKTDSPKGELQVCSMTAWSPMEANRSLPLVARCLCRDATHVFLCFVVCFFLIVLPLLLLIVIPVLVAVC